MKKYVINLCGAFIALTIAFVFGMSPDVKLMAFLFVLAHGTMFALRNTRFNLRDERFACCDTEPTLADVVAEFKTATTELQKRQKDITEAHRLAQKAAEDGQALSAEFKEKIDTQITSINEQKQLISELMQKMDDLRKETKSSQPNRVSLKSALNAALKEREQKFKDFQSREAKSLRLEMKAITTTDGAVGLLSDPYRDELVSLERQPLRVRNLLTAIPVTSDSVKYAKQTVRTNAAKIVAEGTAKPYSNYKWDSATAPIETLAHLSKMTLQAIQDAPRLVAEVESEMRYGLALVEEQEILNGDGTSGHLNGLMNQATAYAKPAGIDDSRIITKVDVLRIAQLQLAMAFAPADAQLLNSVDWADIELLRNSDTDNRYIFGAGPQQTTNKVLWGLPVIDTPSMTQDNFLVGAFKYAVHLYDRMAVAVLISTENDTDFELNQATMRCESRLGLGVVRPYGLVKGTFSTAIPAAGGV